MTLQNSPAWSVAAAILMIEGPMHYRDLTDRVKSLKLSGLESRGGKTASQSIRSIIGSEHDDIFSRRGNRSGIYYVNDLSEAMCWSEVREVAERLFDEKVDEYRELVWSIFHQQLDMSQQHGSSLRKKLEALETDLQRIARLFSKRRSA